MRTLITLLALSSPAAAWEYSPSPVCTVAHESEIGAIELTYDAAQPEPYAIAVTRPEGWSTETIFGLQFEGPYPQTITTNRQVIDGSTLTVRDQGFGNVLNGLQFNETVSAFLGGAILDFSLEAAAPEIERFRDCLVTPIA